MQYFLHIATFACSFFIQVTSSIEVGELGTPPAYSGPSLPPIPLEACHPFHSKAATDSGETCHPEMGV